MGHFVYKITNIVNKKIYIGKTSSKVNKPQHRFRKHELNAFSANQERRDECPKLYRSIRKYGIQNFTFEIIGEYSTETRALRHEKLFIKKFDSFRNGLNSSIGGDHPISGKNNPMYGKGYLRTGEKNPMFGRIGELNPFYGKTHSEEYRLKKSQEQSKFSDEQLAEIKMMLFKGMKGSEIRKIYPNANDKTLTLLRNGTRWTRILPEIKLPFRTNLKEHEAQDVYDIWCSHQEQDLTIIFNNIIKHKYSISYNSFCQITRGETWPNINRKQ